MAPKIDFIPGASASGVVADTPGTDGAQGGVSVTVSAGAAVCLSNCNRYGYNKLVRFLDPEALKLGLAPYASVNHVEGEGTNGVFGGKAVVGSGILNASAGGGANVASNGRISPSLDVGVNLPALQLGMILISGLLLHHPLIPTLHLGVSADPTDIRNSAQVSFGLALGY